MEVHWTVDYYFKKKTVPHVLNSTGLDIFEHKSHQQHRKCLMLVQLLVFLLNLFLCTKHQIATCQLHYNPVKLNLFRTAKKLWKYVIQKKTCSKYKLPPHSVGNILLHVLTIFLHPLVLPVQQPLSITSQSWEFVPKLSYIWLGS